MSARLYGRIVAVLNGHETLSCHGYKALPVALFSPARLTTIQVSESSYALYHDALRPNYPTTCFDVLCGRESDIRSATQRQALQAKKIPRAVIGVHIDITNTLTIPSDEPIPLEDNEDSFVQFYDAMMTPFRSCLLRDEPDLSDVLAVFALAHKFGAAELEDKARILAIKLTRPQVIRDHLSPTLTAMRIFELGREVDCSVIVESAWETISEDFRAHKMPMHQVLSFANRACSPKDAALAYYDVMLRGFRVWNHDALLSNTQRRVLAAGAASCSSALDEILAQWRSGSDYPTHQCSSVNCPRRSEWVAGIVTESAINALPSCDIVGRLEIATRRAQLLAPCPPQKPKKKSNEKPKDVVVIQGGALASAVENFPVTPTELPSSTNFVDIVNGSVADIPPFVAQALSSSGPLSAPLKEVETSLYLKMSCPQVACALAQAALEEQKQHLEQHFQVGLVDIGSPTSSFSEFSSLEALAT